MLNKQHWGKGNLTSLILPDLDQSNLMVILQRLQYVSRFFAWPAVLWICIILIRIRIQDVKKFVTDPDPDTDPKPDPDPGKNYTDPDPDPAKKD